jgi:hypothetical protein
MFVFPKINKNVFKIRELYSVTTKNDMIFELIHG